MKNTIIIVVALICCTLFQSFINTDKREQKVLIAYTTEDAKKRIDTWYSLGYHVVGITGYAYNISENWSDKYHILIVMEK